MYACVFRSRSHVWYVHVMHACACNGNVNVIVVLALAATNAGTWTLVGCLDRAHQELWKVVLGTCRSTDLWKLMTPSSQLQLFPLVLPTPETTATLTASCSVSWTLHHWKHYLITCQKQVTNVTVAQKVNNDSINTFRSLFIMHRINNQCRISMQYLCIQ